jgi:hypothetical protein
MVRHCGPTRHGWQVTVTIHAQSAAGFDKGDLNSGVLEPLREADLIE